MKARARQRDKKFKRWAFAIGCLLGLIAAVLWVRWRTAPPTIPTLSFLRSVKPISKGIDPSSGHQVTVWEVPGDLDQLKDEAADELPASSGWQPPFLRQVKPQTWQIVRVVTPNGDFQFTRWVLLVDQPGKVRVELSVGPLGTRVYGGKDLP